MSEPQHPTYPRGLTISWTHREPPLAPAAVAGGPTLSQATARRLGQGAQLRVANNNQWTLVIGDDLPWADGAIYLGWDDGLLVPTALQPNIPAGLLKHALPPDTLAVLPNTILTGPPPQRTADPRNL